MKKNDLYSISQFAKHTGIARGTLIFYDDIGLFKPFARESNKYRYYSPTQLMTAKVLNALRDFGVPLKRIIELNEQRTPEITLELLKEKQEEAEEAVRRAQSVCRVISTFRKLIEHGRTVDEKIISIQESDEIPLTLGIVNDFQGSPYYFNAFLESRREFKERGIDLNYPIGGYFNDMDTFLASPSRPSRFFSLDPAGGDKKKAGRYLIGYTIGSYGQVNDLPERLAAYAKEHRLAFEGPVYNTYLLDEMSVMDHNNYLLEVDAGLATEMK